MIIDTDKIKTLLFDTSITYGKIRKETGMSKGMLWRYRSGQSPVENMRIVDAKKLQDLYDKLK